LRSVERSQNYLTALETDLPEIAKRPMAIVRELLDEIAGAGESGHA
jgi:hypothetical protein